MRLQALLKSLTGNHNSAKSIWKLICTAVGYVSSVYAFSVLLKQLDITPSIEIWVRTHIWLVIIIGLLAAITHHREHLLCFCKVTGSDIQIGFRVQDFFWVNADSYVIPTNTYFRTKREGDYISSQSVQGRFQDKYYKKREYELDKHIAESLATQRIEGTISRDQFGNVKKYPVGTVAKIDHKGKHYYFVALNDVNEYGKPVEQNLKNIDKALSGVVKAIKEFGHCDTICIPLIGTGRAAIKEATIENVFQSTVNTFAESTEKLSPKVIVCINPNDYIEGRAEISRLEKYLEFKCEFPYIGI